MTGICSFYRYPPPPLQAQVEYSVGDKVVALDKQQNWFLATILVVIK
jgi:hypothetical protein